MTSSVSRAEIVLVRHGPSAHVESGWLDVHGLRRWMDAYDAAEIAPHPAPPPTLEALAADAAHIVTSDLPRTVASALRLAGTRSVERTPLLRELSFELPELPVPALGGIRLPLRGWALVFGARYLSARIRGAPLPGTDSATRARADEAADWLARQVATSRGRVVAVTHLSFRLLIASALVRRGWTGPARRSYREWSAWSYLPPGGSSGPVSGDRLTSGRDSM